MAEWNAADAEHFAVPTEIIDAVEAAIKMGMTSLKIWRDYEEECNAFDRAIGENENRRATLLEGKSIYAIPTVYMPAGVCPILGFTGAPSSDFPENNWQGIEPLVVFRELNTPFSGMEALNETLRQHGLFPHQGRMFCIATSEDEVITSLAKLNVKIQDSWSQLNQSDSKYGPLRVFESEEDVTTEEGIRRWMSAIERAEDTLDHRGKLLGFNDFIHNGDDLSRNIERAAKHFFYPDLENPADPDGMSRAEIIDHAIEFLTALSPHLASDQTAQNVIRGLMTARH